MGVRTDTKDAYNNTGRVTLVENYIQLCWGFSTASQTHRLRSGALPWVGRLEVKIDGKWGTVSDQNFEMTEGNVACRAAGFGSAVAVQSGSQYGRGIGRVHHNNLWYVPFVNIEL